MNTCQLTTAARLERYQTTASHTMPLLTGETRSRITTSTRTLVFIAMLYLREMV